MHKFILSTIIIHMTTHILHVQHTPLHKSTMQNLLQLQTKLNVHVLSVPDVKQVVAQIPHVSPHTQVWLDVEAIAVEHMCNNLKQIHTMLHMLWNLHHQTKLIMHVIVPTHMCVMKLKSLMREITCGWILRSDLSLIHICTQIMQDVTCGTQHVSVSVHKMLQNEPVLTARDKMRISWFTPAHNRILRDAWIKQAYANLHISYNTFETWESFIRSIVMSTFTVHAIVIDDSFLLSQTHVNAFDMINCVHTLRSHAAPHIMHVTFMWL
jgi:hypothetical protein